MRSFHVKENPIGSAVSEILRYKLTNKQTDIVLLCIIDKLVQLRGYSLFLYVLPYVKNIVYQLLFKINDIFCEYNMKHQVYNLHSPSVCRLSHKNLGIYIFGLYTEYLLYNSLYPLVHPQFLCFATYVCCHPCYFSIYVNKIRN